jgi:pilus assembly protein Flp/PilA
MPAYPYSFRSTTGIVGCRCHPGSSVTSKQRGYPVFPTDEEIIMISSIKRFMREEDGVTALEYGLLAAVIAGVLVAVAGPAIGAFFTTLFDKLESVVDTAA